MRRLPYAAFYDDKKREQLIGPTHHKVVPLMVFQTPVNYSYYGMVTLFSERKYTVCTCQNFFIKSEITHAGNI